MSRCEDRLASMGCGMWCIHVVGNSVVKLLTVAVLSCGMWRIYVVGCGAWKLLSVALLSCWMWLMLWGVAW
jgi:hypothetical protein